MRDLVALVEAQPVESELDEMIPTLAGVRAAFGRLFVLDDDDNEW
jgi:hypothetical protein